MKTKKILAILLSAVMLMSLVTVVNAADRPITDYSPFNDFSGGVGGWFTSGTATNSLVSDPDTTSNHGNVLKVSIPANAGLGGARYAFSKMTAITDAVAFEYSIKIPSVKFDGVTANTTGLVSAHFFDRTTWSNSTRPWIARFNASTKKIIGNFNREVGTFELDRWYNVRLEYNVPVASYKITVTDDSGKLVHSFGPFNYQTVYGSEEANMKHVKETGVGAISLHGDEVNAIDFYIDDVHAYTFSANDHEVGNTLVNETMDWTTMENAHSDGRWVPNNSNAYVYNISDSSENLRRINYITEGEDTNKFLRVIATDSANRKYVQFKRSVETKITDFTVASHPKISSKALLYGAKFRISDGDANNVMRLYVTTPKLGEGESGNSEYVLFGFDQSTGTVTAGTKQAGNININDNEWYDLKVYHNAETGYIRAEVIDESNTVQMYEGEYLVANRDFGNITQYGFYNTCGSDVIIDYDDLTITNQSVSNTASEYSFGEGITLSKSAVEAGEIIASVNVASVSEHTNIVNDVANLIIASYEDDRLADISFVGVKPNTYKAQATVTIPEENASAYKVKAMLWDKNMQPLTEAVKLGVWE